MLLVGGSVIAALVGGAWGVAAVLLAFVAYLFVFSRGLKHLPVDWDVWRAPDYRGFMKKKRKGNS